MRNLFCFCFFSPKNVDVENHGDWTFPVIEMTVIDNLHSQFDSPSYFGRYEIWHVIGALLWLLLKLLRTWRWMRSEPRYDGEHRSLTACSPSPPLSYCWFGTSWPVLPSLRTAGHLQLSSKASWRQPCTCLVHMAQSILFVSSAQEKRSLLSSNAMSKNMPSLGENCVLWSSTSTWMECARHMIFWKPRNRHKVGKVSTWYSLGAGEHGNKAVARAKQRRSRKRAWIMTSQQSKTASPRSTFTVWKIQFCTVPQSRTSLQPHRVLTVESLVLRLSMVAPWPSHEFPLSIPTLIETLLAAR